MYAPYVRLTVYFHLQNGQDGRPLRSTLRATQILATDSFKREGNRTTRSETLQPLTQARIQTSYEGIAPTNLPPHSRISQDLSKVVSRSHLYTMPTGKALRRTLSNTTAAEGSENRSLPDLRQDHVLRNIAPLQHPTFISISLSLYISFIQANTRSVSASTLYAIYAENFTGP